MVTSGFYDSISHDRQYSSIQFGQIFDGVVRDGIFMSVGTQFRITESADKDMNVLVGIGRAWFDHTWIYNDAPLAITIPSSELLLNRIDAIVIDVDANQEIRENRIMVVSGTPASSPTRPTLIKTTLHNQYPLAYVYVGREVTGIRQADITNAVGLSDTPFVTGILSTINTSDLISQWKDQWDLFFETQSMDMANTNKYWKDLWQEFYTTMTGEVREDYEAWLNEWRTWSASQKQIMLDEADEWQTLWQTWFYNYVNENQSEHRTYMTNREAEFRTWFNGIKGLLTDDAATNLANLLTEVREKVTEIEDFRDNITAKREAYPAITDSSDQKEQLLDSNGDPILGRVIFKIM